MDKSAHLDFLLQKKKLLWATKNLHGSSKEILSPKHGLKKAPARSCIGRLPRTVSDRRIEQQ
jgi:hypothetical protein